MKKKDSNKQDVDDYNEFLKERDDSDDFEQEVIEFGDNVENKSLTIFLMIQDYVEFNGYNLAEHLTSVDIVEFTNDMIEEEIKEDKKKYISNNGYIF